jgi:hypothetical protein
VHGLCGALHIPFQSMAVIWWQCCTNLNRQWTHRPDQRARGKGQGLVAGKRGWRGVRQCPGRLPQASGQAPGTTGGARAGLCAAPRGSEVGGPVSQVCTAGWPEGNRGKGRCVFKTWIAGSREQRATSDPPSNAPLSRSRCGLRPCGHGHVQIITRGKKKKKKQEATNKALAARRETRCGAVPSKARAAGGRAAGGNLRNLRNLIIMLA